MNKGKQLETLVHFATGIGCHVSLVPLQYNDGRVKGKRIGIRATMSIDEYVHNIAHELAHIYLHTGEVSADDKEKETQAENVADLIVGILEKC